MAKKKCPECNHEFKGNGWDGIDAHWRSKHSHIMRYEEVWPLLASGSYKRKHELKDGLADATARQSTYDSKGSDL